MTDAFLSLLALAGVGGMAIASVLGVRARDQRARDGRRVVVTLGFPRGVTDDQVTSVVRAVLGLAPATAGIAGQDSVAFEIVGSRTALTHRLRLPASASDYLIAQVRAAVPGISIDEVDEDELRDISRPRQAIELRRRVTTADLATSEAAVVSRMVMAAATGLHRAESVVWGLVVMGGISARPEPQVPVVRRLMGEAPPPPTTRKDSGMARVTLRLGATATSDKRAGELVSRLRRAASSTSAPGARLVPRWLPRFVVSSRLVRAATPITHAPVLLRPEELTALVGWPIDSPLIPGLSLGGSPQLPAAATVPRHGRVLGRASVGNHHVAQPTAGAREHTLIIGPTGAGKTWLGVRLFLDDVAAGRGGLYLDPKGGAAKAIIERLPASAIGRTVVIDPTDAERPVPVSVLAAEPGAIPQLPGDTFVGLLTHRHRDLGPRSTDILSASLHALARVPDASLMDLLLLWGDTRFRARVVALVRDDPVLVSFFSWFDSLGAAERSYVLAAPMNKVRPLLQRPVVRNVIAAPRQTFSLAEALREGLVVIVTLPEGVLGGEATSLLGQVVLARLWAAVQARRNRSLYLVTVDEAPRFVDQPSDLGEVLARSREYGVGFTLVGQSLSQFPTHIREIALNSARSKIAFGTSASDARQLAQEFGPGVEADYFAGLGRYEAIGSVSLGGTVSPPFTFTTDALGERIPGRAKAIRAASREKWGVPREEIEAALSRATAQGGEPPGAVGRRATP